MTDEKDMKWNIELDDIKSPMCKKKIGEFQTAKTQMQQRTYHHELYGLLAKNKSIHEWKIKGKRGKYFSEGSTQYILRKTLADTIQRVPDGELTTQYDNDSVENIWIQYLFDNKVMWSEFKGVDMLSNLTNAYKMSFIYAFAAVRTGFEKDFDDDARISFNLENWADVFVDPDCKDIRSASVVWHRQYMSKSDVEALIDDDGNVYDSTYEEDTIKYVLDHKLFSAKQWESEKLADKLKGSTSLESLELITEYRRGDDEFVTYVPAINAVFRRVRNYDPRKEIPWHFLVLETDPDFPLGVSQVEFLLGDQQFNDLFQTSAYKNLLLAMEPPIMVSGWETNPSSYRFEPRKIWNLGNNPNQVKVEPVKIDNSVLSGWSKTRESIAASMMRNLNAMDGTIAKDSGTSFSKTAPGVDAQQTQKTININQYQKRVEMFVQEWAVDALRCYINAMSGVHELTVDEETRRRLFDIGAIDCIHGNKVAVDFDMLSADMLEYKVRVGSLVQKKEDQELERLTTMVQPFIQNLNGWSEQNRAVVENEILLPVMRRMVELSDTDISKTLSDSLTERILDQHLADIKADMQQQQMQQAEMQQQIEGIAKSLPQESQQQLQGELIQDLGEQPMAAVGDDVQGGIETPSNPDASLDVSAGHQVVDPRDMLVI